MIKVQLHNLQFNSFHGIHDEEKILGNDYVVNVSVEFHEETELINSIHETINYAEIYKIIKSGMDHPTPLLETVIMEAGKSIHHKFPELHTINISIEKMHPPIEGMQGSAIVSWHKEY